MTSKPFQSEQTWIISIILIVIITLKCCLPQNVNTFILFSSLFRYHFVCLFVFFCFSWKEGRKEERKKERKKKRERKKDRHKERNKHGTKTNKMTSKLFQSEQTWIITIILIVIITLKCFLPQNMNTIKLFSCLFRYHLDGDFVLFCFLSFFIFYFWKETSKVSLNLNEKMHWRVLAYRCDFIKSLCPSRFAH